MYPQVYSRGNPPFDPVEGATKCTGAGLVGPVGDFLNMYHLQFWWVLLKSGEYEMNKSKIWNPG